ncbi:NAD(P)/FAD-dependent oxidoreductase [Pedobacter glucosidilyticus]|uniref:NAD(P)/FAD-dependent oxidoreductase n=1 Tax=Pedobacter glucosidilyticus TaxID=1122941 RepID=UPI0026EDFB74|nr:NAD(P)/FAD-dependent oxidoreductase [Pedobacter glucosidilyticus]
MSKKPKIFIAGGGLAGLTNAILLSKAGFEVCLAERKFYPFHRVCGEYVSNEALPFLKSLGLNPEDLQASKLEKLIIAAPSGKTIQAPLDLGGCGVSRYILDEQLYLIAKQQGVAFLLGEKISNIHFQDEQFNISISEKTYHADVVIGAFGKRSNLDKQLQRSSFYKRSPYMGVKYHIKLDFPKDTIRLDNFESGYCGLNSIGNNSYCLCYLSENKHLKKYGSIAAVEEQILSKNPFLKEVFHQAEFLWDKPETINEIAFERKNLIENHILMCGDTAGMIAPLCGNGMAIAIHSAKILSSCIVNICQDGINPSKRTQLEKIYSQLWQQEFANRLFIGRTIQKLFGRNVLSEMAIGSLNHFPKLLSFLVKQTHGEVF